MPERHEAQTRGFVGLLTAELYFPGVTSLKHKRSYLRHLRDRLTGRYQASFAEIGYQDLWQRTRVLVAVAASDLGRLQGVLSDMDGYLHSQDWQVLVVEEEIIEVDG